MAGGVIRGKSRHVHVTLVKSACFAAIAVFVVSALPASAVTSSWRLQSTPNPAGSRSSALEGVACPSTTVCIAVGVGHGTLAERRKGNKWVVQSTPNPSGASNSLLTSVACPSTTRCSAVGAYFDSSAAQVTLAERWDGSTWEVQPTPNAAGAAGSLLTGVACPSTTLCTAVGVSTDSSGNQSTLAERWNGSTWVVQPTPNPIGATISQLGSVDCPSTTLCTAVGLYYDSSGTAVTLAERWSENAWVIQPTPNPSGAMGSGLTGVACPSTTSCTAVGEYGNSSGVGVALGERWNGSTWVVQRTPNPSGATFSTLATVACPSSTQCVAVGYYKKNSGVEVPLAELWNGGTWGVQSTPNPSGTSFSGLNDVACASAMLCTAVGLSIEKSGLGVTLAERYS